MENPPPQLSYRSSTNPWGTYDLPSGGSLTVWPTVGPSDNTKVFSIEVQSQSGFAGTVSVEPETGVVHITDYGRFDTGVYIIIIHITDSCGASSDAAILMTAK